MTGLAAINHTQLRYPDLLDTTLKMSAQCDRVAAIANQPQVLVLVTAPLAEEVLCRGDGQHHQQHHAGDAERTNRVAIHSPQEGADRLVLFLHATPPGL